MRAGIALGGVFVQMALPVKVTVAVPLVVMRTPLLSSRFGGLRVAAAQKVTVPFGVAASIAAWIVLAPAAGLRDTAENRGSTSALPLAPASD